MANGLINLQTDLKSLRYGSETPYVTKDINNPPLSDKIGIQASRRIDDTSRIVQMLASKPGLKYLANEALLQQINAEDKMSKAIKGGKSVAGAILQQIGGTFVGTVKIVGSTLAQVPINGTGTHFLKGFRTDTYLQPANPGNTNAFTRFFGAGGVEGAPLALEGQPIEGKVESQFFTQGSTINNGAIVNPSNSTVEPKFAYYSKVQPVGEGTLSANEKPNKSLPENDANRLSAYNAVEGNPITLGYKKPVTFGSPPTKEFGDLSPTIKRAVQTTPTPGTPSVQSSIKSRSNTVAQKDWASPNSANNVSSASYSYNNTYTKREAKTSINNAQTGAPIPIFPLDSSQKETTLASSGIGYGDAAWLQGEQDNFNNSIDRYSQYATYTETKTEENIQNTLNGSPIRVALSGSEQNNTTVRLGELHDLTTADPIEIFTPSKLEKEWNKKDPYTGTFTEENIGAVKNDKQIGLKVDTNTDGFISDARAINEVTQVDTVGTFNQDSVNTDIAYLNNVRKEKRVRLGDQGFLGVPGTDFQKAKNQKANYYWITDPDRTGVDVLNALEPSTTSLDSIGKDFAKFYFELITPDGSQFLHFRAFIDSIDDSYSADWQGRKYNGRAENFYTYGGFDRDINVSFNIAAASREELMPMYRKMIYLASATAPTYGDKGLMRGTLARLTIGSYFSHIPGVITSVKYSLDPNAPWEIQLGRGVNDHDDDVQSLPMLLKCSISFKPIHDFAPQTGLYPYFTEMKEPKEDKAVVKTKKKKEVKPVPKEKKDNFVPPKVVPVRVQESTGTAQNSRIKTDSERAMKANGLVPKKTLEQIGIDYKKDLEESKKKKLQIVKY